MKTSIYFRNKKKSPPTLEIKYERAKINKTNNLKNVVVGSAKKYGAFLIFLRVGRLLNENHVVKIHPRGTRTGFSECSSAGLRMQDHSSILPRPFDCPNDNARDARYGWSYHLLISGLISPQTCCHSSSCP